MTTYSIIGAGAIGTALAQQFSRKNIRVKIANTRGGESLSDLTAALGNNVEATSDTRRSEGRRRHSGGAV